MYSHFWNQDPEVNPNSESQKNSFIYWINHSDKGFDSEWIDGSVKFMESFSSNMAMDSWCLCIMRSDFSMYKAISSSDSNDFYWDRM